MNISQDRLKSLVQTVFAIAGCVPAESERIAHYLVEANLVGHDSHGVIRVADYIRYLRSGMVRPNQSLQIVLESDAFAVVDGQLGFGQVIGQQAMQLGIEKARRAGVAAVALRNSGHLGRIGDWAEMGANAGLISLHFVNTSGFGLLVAPYGGIDRRLSANPIAAGVPVATGPPIILDISTCAIAEGKIKVARNKGVPVPAGCIMDSAGNPTTDPAVFYADPPGSILPFGGHKGYGLSLLAELLAGALTGGGCSNPAAPQLVNGMLTVLLDPARFAGESAFGAEVLRYVQFVKSSRLANPRGEILLPGELEQRTREQRLRDGIELDDVTWSQLVDCAKSLGISVDEMTGVVNSRRA